MKNHANQAEQELAHTLAHTLLPFLFACFWLSFFLAARLESWFRLNTHFRLLDQEQPPLASRVSVEIGLRLPTKLCVCGFAPHSTLWLFPLPCPLPSFISFLSGAASEGVVIASEKKFGSILVDKDSITKVGASWKHTATAGKDG